ncbi:MAG: cytochrome c oxidase subunit 3 [Candidatus Thermoplasmatota archaeon]
MSAPPATGHDDAADHPHLPHGSVWPFWLAMAIAFLGIGLVLFGQSLKAPDPSVFLGALSTPAALVVLGLGVLALVGTLIGWFVEDYKWWPTNTGTGTHIPKAGALLFISSELFLFGALFANYFTFQHLSKVTGLGWPDADIHLPLVNTAIFSLFLFASSGTLHKSEKLLKAGDHKGFVRWWWITILLGLIFLGGQVMEYATLIHEGHTLGSSQYITAFYILTGTHGLHVLGGLCLLAVMGVRASKGQFTATRHAGPQVAGMYWHFVDIIWVIVLVVIYILPALGFA